MERLWGREPDLEKSGRNGWKDDPHDHLLVDQEIPPSHLNGRTKGWEGTATSHAVPSGETRTSNRAGTSSGTGPGSTTSMPSVSMRPRSTWIAHPAICGAPLSQCVSGFPSSIHWTPSGAAGVSTLHPVGEISSKPPTLGLNAETSRYGPALSSVYPAPTPRSAARKLPAPLCQMYGTALRDKAKRVYIGYLFPL